MATITVTPIKTFVSGETVTPTKLNELSQSTVALTAGSIVAADIASDAVTTAKILDANVTNAKIASGVDAAKLTTGTLPADRIGSSAITTARINDAAVTAAKLDGAQSGAAPIYGCRAWVNFDGTRNEADTGSSTNGANVKIRASGNVASVRKNSAGDYTVTFSTAMLDANFVANVTGAANSSGLIGATNDAVTARAAASIRLQFTNSAGSDQDCPNANVIIFR